MDDAQVRGGESAQGVRFLIDHEIYRSITQNDPAVTIPAGKVITQANGMLLIPGYREYAAKARFRLLSGVW